MSATLQSTTRAPMQPVLFRAGIRTTVTTVDGARTILGSKIFSEDDVVELIEFGGLAWAWNVAQRASRRREFRVLVHCVEQYARVFNAGSVNHRWEPENNLTFKDVAGLILPPQWHNKPFIEGIDFAEAMLFGSDLLQDLIGDGSLRTVAGSQPRRGRGGSALLKMESVLEFLKERRA